MSQVSLGVPVADRGRSQQAGYVIAVRCRTNKAPQLALPTLDICLQCAIIALVLIRGEKRIPGPLKTRLL